MPDPTPAAYSIVPWVRRGLASLITGQPATNFASLPVSLAVNGAPATAPPIRLIGPGDVTALDPRAVVRTEPRDGAPAFEPNYLAAVEFALPDLPWMFTPTAPAGGRLKPWICLVVVPDGDGVVIERLPGGMNVLHIDSPLDPKSELPDLATIDAWAHAQVTGSGLAGAALNAALDGDPSLALSRLIAPRELEAGKSYIACVVPTYRAGVNAALGRPVDDRDLAPAWDSSVAAPFVLPVYYQFRFHTGLDGDFASLARRIKPPKTPVEAGTRTMDVSRPGFGAADAPGVTLGLEGALRSVDNRPTAWPAGAQSAYEAQLRKALAPPAAADPVVAPPTYGSAQTGADLSAAAPPVWSSQLNLDPRSRAAASAGAQVVQRDREALVASAWDQLGEIRKANQLLRQAQLARQVTASLGRRHLDTVAGDGTYLQITAPLHGRVRLSLNGVDATLRGHIASSRVPSGAVSPALRRITRSRGPVGRRLSAGTPQIVDRLNLPATSGPTALQVAGPVEAPRGMVALDDVSPDIQVTKMTALSAVSAGGFKTAEVATPPAAPHPGPGGGILTGGAVFTDGGGEPPTKVNPLVDWTANPNLPDLLKGDRPNLPAALVFPSDAAALKLVEERYRTASAAVNTYLNTAPAAPAEPAPLAGQPTLALPRAQLAARVNPEVTIQARFGARVPLGSGPDPLQPVRTGPEFPQAMYPALAQISPEWLLPGISALPEDCAALLTPNSKFIEAFMAGLNEELSRELLWREFPADRRLTYFHNFWGAPTPDIPEIAAFDPNGGLGDHVTDHASGNRFVLLIRASLFQRYPNAVVSAIQAAWAG
jgi:hypothetical protein